MAETLPGGAMKILVAIADVDALVKKGSAIDEHARQNTTSVYTAGEIFPMLPEKLSTDLTSLGFQEDRPAIVIEMLIGEDGSLRGSKIYRATVRNRAKLAYNSVAAWLEGKGPMPGPVAAVEGLDANLRAQDLVAQKLKLFRHEHGALDLETIEARPVFDGEEIRIRGRKEEPREGAHRGFHDRGQRGDGELPHGEEISLPAAGGPFPGTMGADRGGGLPVRRSSSIGARLGGPGEFPGSPQGRRPSPLPDLSLTIVKLMGRGEYVVEFPEKEAPGHFGLAVRDYTHSTAPNRRYPDLITQRLLKAALSGSPALWKGGTTELARHCTEKEDDANKVERQVGKSAAAMLLESRIGDRFDAIVTGASEKGTWVRLLHPPVEGKLIHGFKGADVGHRVRVQLVHTDVDRGYIDFKKVD